MSSHLPFDPEEINIEITELSSLEQRVAIEVPARLVKRFHKKMKKSGQSLDDEAMRNHLSRFCLEEIIKRLELNPIWGPIPSPGSPEPRFRTEHPFRFSMDIDTAPEIKWPDFKTIEIIRPVREITEDMIEDEMVEQRRDAGIQSPLESDLAVGDEACCNVVMKEPGTEQPLLASDDMTIRVMSQDKPTVVGGMAVEGAGKALEGHKVGDEVVLETVVPEQYPDPTMIGKDVHFTFNIKGATRAEMATVEQVVAQYDSPSELVLRQQIKFALKAKSDHDQLKIMTTQLFDFLDEVIVFDIPRRALDSYVNAITDLSRKSLEQRGYEGDDLEKQIERRREKVQDIARKQAKRRVIIRMLADEFNLKVGENAIMNLIGEMAAEQGRRPEELRQELIDAGKIVGLGIEVMEQKGSDKVFELARITDMPLDEWLQQQRSIKA